MAETGAAVDYLVGTMIELPRAAIRAHVIAESAEFFSFGTNDLTQTTFGISRDDATSFLETYRHSAAVADASTRSASVSRIATIESTGASPSIWPRR